MILYICLYTQPITVAVRTKTLNTFAHLNTGIAGSNTTPGMDVCVVLCW
jgi:hypothetical protein